MDDTNRKTLPDLTGLGITPEREIINLLTRIATTLEKSAAAQATIADCLVNGWVCVKHIDD
jgi:hypothetical protein